MKHEEAFDKWILNTCNRTCTTSASEGWEACEEFMDSRKCEDCKYSEIRGCYKDNFIGCLHLKHGVGKDFYCKYWETK